MNLFYFGPRAAPLFGVEHPPAQRRSRRSGIVIAPPMGTELMRSHRALRQLATGLAKEGHHVLRFDYYGTGDSSGDCEEGQFAVWRDNVAAAVEELRERAELDEVSLIGLRLGAALIAQASADIPDIRRLTLWDPIIDGAAYLEDRIRTDSVYEAAEGHDEKTAQRLADGETIGILGIAMSAALRCDLTALSVAGYTEAKAEHVDLIVSSEYDQVAALKAALGEQHQLGYECIPGPGEWGELDAIGSLLLPHQIIKAITASYRTQ
ncbi:MAG: alpha/beta hydrolase [Pseudomonadota bacterium]